MREDLAEIVEKLRSLGDRLPGEVRIGKRARLGRYKPGQLIDEGDGMRIIFDPRVAKDCVVCLWGEVENLIFI